MRLLGVFAHPDDETYMMAGSLARYTDEGVVATILTFTRGEFGGITPGSGATRETLGAVREAELREACRIVGCGDVRIVGTPDSGTEANEAGVAAIVEVITELQPAVVVTMEPEGITSHPDHIAVCKMTTEAVESSDTEGIVKRLFYGAVPQSLLDDAARLALELGTQPPFDPGDPLRPRGADPSTIACVVDTANQLERKTKALWAHKTQSQEFVAAQPPEMIAAVLGREWFQRAIPPFAHGDAISNDLLEGLR